MSYDRFEDDWNGIPAPMVDRTNPSKTYSTKTRVIHRLNLLLRTRVVMFRVGTENAQRLKRRRHSSVLLAASGRLRRDN